VNRRGSRRVFGPVVSRRLGRSLGVDPVPFKTCNQNCVYCQLGRTRNFTRRRRSFFSTTEIFSEIATSLERNRTPGVDWITFVGSGETTLFTGLGPLIRFVRAMTEIPVAVITNGTLLSHAAVRRELRTVNAVLTSVDAGTHELYQRINRPLPDLTLDRHIDGLVAFRDVYQGGLWVEIMLVKALNDTPEALADLVRVLHRVAPDEIHLMTPTRPPAEPWVEPPDRSILNDAVAAFEKIAKVIVPGDPDRDLELDDQLDAELDQALVDIVIRHPLRENEVRRIVERQLRAQTSAILSELASNERIRVVDRLGDRFWCASDSDFPDRRKDAGPTSRTVIHA